LRDSAFMDTNLIWLIAIALEAAILFRGLRTGLQKRYLLFYCYIGCLLLIEVLRFLCLSLTPNLYSAFYWQTELVRIVASYAVIFEIFKRVLRHNPGVARIAQDLLLVVFVVALTYAASDLLHGGFASVPRATADLGRYLLYVESAVLLVMLWLFGRYRISFGGNLLGLTLGYSLLVALDVVNLAFLSTPGNESSIGLRKLIPITHLITFIIWCASLWSSQPELLPPAESAIDRDYALLAAKTRAALAHMSTRVGRTLGP
jgi:hypothetical protein